MDTFPSSWESLIEEEITIQVHVCILDKEAIL